MLLIEAANHVGRDADEGAERRGRLDAVLAAVPRAAEHERDLLEVVHEELLRLFVESSADRGPPNASRGEQLLQLLRERRLRDAPAADAEQLDLVVQRRVLAIVQRAHHVVRRREVFVAVELPARQADQVRRVQPRVLRVDGHEHLNDVILGQPVEDDGRNAEVLARRSGRCRRAARAAGAGRRSRAECPSRSGTFRMPTRESSLGRLKRELLVAAR